jgi:tetratricopeptide (TPR) repeat protein
MIFQSLVIFLFLALSPTQAQRPAASGADRQEPAEELFKRASELQQQGRWPEAASAWRGFLAREPQHAGAHANLGAVLARLGRYEEALASYETALGLNPGLTPIFYNLGLAHYRAGQYARAAEALTRFLSFAPDSAPAHQLLGLALVETARDEEAVAHLESALAANPNDPAALYALGLAYLRLHRSKFQETVERLARVPDGVALSHLLTGQSLLAASNHARAVEAFEEAARLKADLPRLHFSLGLAYLRQGQNGEAARAFERELQQLPRDFWTLYYLAYLHEAEGKLDLARQRLDIALKVEPQSAEANSLLGKILLKAGQAAEAVAPLEIAVAQKPDDSNIRFQLARAYQASGRRAEAAREFAEVQRLKDQGIEKERSGLAKPE